MTSLVTGAAGFLGSHVADLLLAGGERPRVLVRPGESVDLWDGQVDVYRGDVGDRAVLDGALAGVDRVLHCAARTGPWGPEAEYQATNVRALQTLVEAAMSAGVKHVVHVSSMVVHGTDVRGRADETAPLRGGRDPYSATKVAGERLLSAMIRDQHAPVTIVRPGWVYGPRDQSSFGRMAAMIESRRMVMLGAGRNHLPLIYVTDAARGVLLASESPRGLGGAYLLVNDQPVTQRDYLGAIASELGAAPPSRRMPYRLAVAAGAAAEAAGRLARLERPPPLTRFGVQMLGGENRYSISRARRDLGFAPSIDLHEGVQRAVAWYRTGRATGAQPRQDRSVSPEPAGAGLSGAAHHAIREH